MAKPAPRSLEDLKCDCSTKPRLKTLTGKTHKLLQIPRTAISIVNERQDTLPFHLLLQPSLSALNQRGT